MIEELLVRAQIQVWRCLWSKSSANGMEHWWRNKRSGLEKNVVSKAASKSGAFYVRFFLVVSDSYF